MLLNNMQIPTEYCQKPPISLQRQFEHLLNLVVVYLLNYYIQCHLLTFSIAIYPPIIMSPPDAIYPPITIYSSITVCPAVTMSSPVVIGYSIINKLSGKQCLLIHLSEVLMDYLSIWYGSLYYHIADPASASESFLVCGSVGTNSIYITVGTRREV